MTTDQRAERIQKESLNVAAKLRALQEARDARDEARAASRAAQAKYEATMKDFEACKARLVDLLELPSGSAESSDVAA